MHKLLYILLFSIFHLLSFAQKVNIDSLLSIWNQEKSADSVRFNAITIIINHYSDNNPDSSFRYAQLKHEFAVKKSNKTAQVQALRATGQSLYYKGDNVRAMNYYNQCIALYKEMNDSISVVDTYNDIGNIHIELGNFQYALDYYLKSLKISERLEDKQGIAVSYMNIGNIYYAQKKADLALKNYFKALESNEALNRKNGIADCYINISAVYSLEEKYKDAIDYLLKASKICEEIGDELGLMFCYNNLGDNYIKLNEYEKALSILLQSEKIGLEKGYKPALAVCYINMGDIYLRQNKFDNAYHYLSKSLAIVEEIKYKEYAKEIYRLISLLYEKKGDYKKAFEYQLLYANIKDTLLNEESSRQITEMNAKYESEKKEKDIALLTKDQELYKKNAALKESQIKNQRVFNYIIAGALILALLLAFVIYYRYTTKQKLNTILRNKNTELIDKNALIELQKEKIIDNITYAKRIQQSILISEKEIQKYLPDSFIYYQPKDIVSGDFYWFSKINEKIIIAAIDCTGHGVSGAFMSLIGNTLLNQIVNEKNQTKPSEILRLLNLEVYQALNTGKDEALSRDGMDMVLCAIDFKTKQLEFAGAQNAIYIVNNNELEIIKGDGFTVGGSEGNTDPTKREYTNHLLTLKENTSIYLFTDGYTDQFGGPNRKKFGMQQFKDLILSSQQMSMQTKKDTFESTLAQWKGNETQTDDILVIGVQL